MFDKYSNSFLKDFNFDSILEKFDRKFFCNFSGKEMIYREKEEIENIYFILSGEVKLVKTEKYNNTEYTIRKPAGGDIIGLDDALMGRQYSSSAYAIKNSNLLAINKEDFMDLTKKNDEFNLWVLKYLSSGMFDLIQR